MPLDLESRGPSISVSKNVPKRDPELGERLLAYQNVRRAAFGGFSVTGGVFVSTRFGDSPQIHHVQNPLGYREQLTYCNEPIVQCRPCPMGWFKILRLSRLQKAQDNSQISIKPDLSFIYGRDNGGDENVQYYFFDAKTSKHHRITQQNSEGKNCMNRSLFWSETQSINNQSGHGQQVGAGSVAYVSNIRDGKHFDLYVIRGKELADSIYKTYSESGSSESSESNAFVPPEPVLVYQSDKTGYLVIHAFEDTKILVQHYVSVTDSKLFLIDLGKEFFNTVTVSDANIKTSDDGTKESISQNCFKPLTESDVIHIAPSQDYLSSGQTAAIGASALLLDQNAILFSSDEDTEFTVLRSFCLKEKKETHKVIFDDNPENNWSITDIVIAKNQKNEIERGGDGTREVNNIANSSSNEVVLVYNEEGGSVFYRAGQANDLLDSKKKWPCKRQKLTQIPQGVAGHIEFNIAVQDSLTQRDIKLGFSIVTSSSPSDVYTITWSNPIAALHAPLIQHTKSEVGGLNRSNFISAELIRYKSSFDELEIPAFIYRPKTQMAKRILNQNQNSMSMGGKFPIIIHPHGGPEGQHTPTFVPIYQYLLLELGICIIDPNVRGSSGYGKTFVSLDNGYKREDSVKDIGSLLDWIDKNQEEYNLDNKRIAIWGGSYGGYMVLASLIHYPQRIMCGIDIVGISNFVTFLENTSSYRRELRRLKYGDESDPQMREFLMKISPLSNCEKLVQPLFVVQGANDPRVPVSEAEQIYEKANSNSSNTNNYSSGDDRCWYMVGLDEGHGFKKKSNIDAYQEAMIQFWKKYLLKQQYQEGGIRQLLRDMSMNLSKL